MQNSNIFKKVFYKFFWVLMAFTMLLAIFQIIKVQYNGINKFIIIISFILFTTLSMLFWYLISKKDNKSDFGIVIGIVLVATSLKILSYLIFQTEPVSDFTIAHDFYSYYLQHGSYVNDSSYDFYQLYFSRFPAWFTYMQILRGIYYVLGFNIKLVIALNICLNALTMVIIYNCGKFAFSRKMGIMAMIIYGFSPSLILYSGITTPDHFSMLLISLVILFWFKAEKYREEKNKYSYVYIIILCFTYSLLNLFKPLSVLLLIVFVCVEIAITLVPNLKDFKIILKLNYKYWIMFVATFLLMNVIINSTLNYSVERFFKREIVNATPMYLYAGWGADEQGNYSQENTDKNIYFLMEKYGDNQEDMMKEFSVLANQQILDNQPFLLQILYDKFKEVMGSEYSYYGFANTSTQGERAEAINNSMGPIWLVLAITYMGLIYLSIFLLSLVQIVGGKMDRYILILGVTFFGYLSIIMLSVVQSRYKSIIMPIVSILAAYTFTYFNEMKNVNKLRIRNYFFKKIWK